MAHLANIVFRSTPFLPRAKPRPHPQSLFLFHPTDNKRSRSSPESPDEEARLDPQIAQHFPLYPHAGGVIINSKMLLPVW